MIHEHYVFAQGTSKYPCIDVAGFTRLCQRWGIFGRKGLSVADIDRLFAQLTYVEVDGEQVDLANNPDGELCRYEFCEILVRIAKELYEGVTVAEAIVLLIE